MLLAVVLVFRDYIIEWSYEMKRYLDMLEVHRGWISVLGCACGLYAIYWSLWNIRKGLTQAIVIWLVGLASGVVQTLLAAVLTHNYFKERARRAKRDGAYTGGQPSEEAQEPQGAVGRFFEKLSAFENRLALAALVLLVLLTLVNILLEWPGNQPV
jgi:hypothetical protein